MDVWNKIFTIKNLSYTYAGLMTTQKLSFDNAPSAHCKAFSFSSTDTGLPFDKKFWPDTKFPQKDVGSTFDLLAAQIK